jgi:hypothetical protein
VSCDNAVAARHGASARHTFEFLPAPSGVTAHCDMTLPPDIPSPPTDLRPGFRVVLKARASGPIAYGWEIVGEDGFTAYPFGQSSAAERAMEEAFANGTIALGRVGDFRSTDNCKRCSPPP